jgi:hypothetical protein
MTVPYTNDEGLPWNHLDPPQVGDVPNTEPIDLTEAPF